MAKKKRKSIRTTSRISAFSPMFVMNVCKSLNLQFFSRQIRTVNSAWTKVASFGSRDLLTAETSRARIWWSVIMVSGGDALTCLTGFLTQVFHFHLHLTVSTDDQEMTKKQQNEWISLWTRKRTFYFLS